MMKLLQAKKLIVVIACLVNVSACAHVKLATVWALRDVDLLTVDPGIMRLALALPRGASFSAVTVKMKFIRAGNILIDEDFELEIITDGPEMSRYGLPGHLENLHVLRVPKTRIADMVNFQTEYISERTEPRGSQATFGIGSKLDPEWLDEYCGGGKRALEISAWILVDDQQGYLPLLKDSQIGRLLGAQSRDFCSQHVANARTH